MKKLKEIKPDAIVADWWCVPAMKAAWEMNIPLIFNYIGPISMAKNYFMYPILDFENATTWFGSIYFNPTLWSQYMKWGA